MIYDEVGSGGAVGGGWSGVYAVGGVGTTPTNAMQTTLLACPTIQLTSTNVYVRSASANGVSGVERPFVLVVVDDDLVKTKIETGAFNMGPVPIKLLIEMDVNPGNAGDGDAIFYDAQWFIDQLIDDIWNIVGIGNENQLAITDIDETRPPERAWVTEDDDYTQALLTITLNGRS